MWRVMNKNKEDRRSLLFDSFGNLLPLQYRADRALIKWSKKSRKNINN